MEQNSACFAVNPIIANCVIYFSTRFFVVLEKLVEHGVSSPVAALGFLQACIEHTESKTTLPVDVSWRLWSIVVNPLMEHIMKAHSTCILSLCFGR